MDPKRRRFLKTTCLCAGLFIIGYGVALIGVSLPTLAFDFNIPENYLYFAVSVRGVGFLIGSFVAAIFITKINPWFLLAASLSLNAAAHIATPFAQNAIFIAGLQTVIGGSMAVLHSGSYVLIMIVWENESGPWVQALGFFMALGSNITPVVTKFFIIDAPNINLTSTDGNVSGLAADRNHTIFSFMENMGFPRIAWAYLIPAMMSIFVASAFFFIAISGHVDKYQQSCITQLSEPRNYRVQVISILFMYFLLIDGAQFTFVTYLYSYAIYGRKNYSKYEGTSLNTLFCGAFAASCFCAIFLAKFMTARAVATCSLVGAGVATSAMSLLPLYANSADWIFWLSVALYGFSIGNVLPSGFSLGEQYITMDERAGTIFIIGGALGAMACPALVGAFFKQNPDSLLYFSFASTVLLIILLLLLLKIASNRDRNQEMVELLKNRSIR